MTPDDRRRMAELEDRGAGWRTAAFLAARGQPEAALRALDPEDAGPADLDALARVGAALEAAGALERAARDELAEALVRALPDLLAALAGVAGAAVGERADDPLGEDLARAARAGALFRRLTEALRLLGPDDDDGQGGGGPDEADAA